MLIASSFLYAYQHRLVSRRKDNTPIKVGRLAHGRLGVGSLSLVSAHIFRHLEIWTRDLRKWRWRENKRVGGYLDLLELLPGTAKNVNPMLSIPPPFRTTALRYVELQLLLCLCIALRTFLYTRRIAVSYDLEHNNAKLMGWLIGTNTNTLQMLLFYLKQQPRIKRLE